MSQMLASAIYTETCKDCHNLKKSATIKPGDY